MPPGNSWERVKSWNFLYKPSRIWKVLENQFDPGNWKVLEIKA